MLRLPYSVLGSPPPVLILFVQRAVNQQEARKGRLWSDEFSLNKYQSEFTVLKLHMQCRLFCGDVKPLTAPQIIRSSKKIPRDECFRPPQGFIL